MSASIANELKQALKVLEDASVPDDLRPVAFASAFWAARDHGLKSAGRRTPAPAPSPGTVPDGFAPSAEPDSGSGDLKKIAEKLSVSVEDVEFVYELDGKDLGLLVPPSRLAPVLKDAVKQIIYLVAAGRQACGFDTKTSAQEVKEVCAERGKADTNFSRIVDELHGEGLIVGGSGRAKTVGVNGDGFERAGEIVKQLRA